MPILRMEAKKYGLLSISIIEIDIDLSFVLSNNTKGNLCTPKH